MEEQLKLSEFCHSHNISFILASVRGLFGQIFCDFGASFEIVDADGENPLSAMIASITKEVRYLSNIYKFCNSSNFLPFFKFAINVSNNWFKYEYSPTLGKERSDVL